MIESVLKSKFFGALIGTGVGDALGAPFEGRRRVKLEEIEAVAERREVLTYTDDTHMMIGVAESLIRAGGFDGEDMAHTFIKNYELEPFRGYGPGPPHIFRLIKDGVAWHEAARGLYHSGSYGNGSAMRIAPIGVFYHDNPRMLKEIAYKSSQITHAHNLGKEGAALQAYAIGQAVSIEPLVAFDRDGLLAKLIDYTPERVYIEKLNRIKALLAEPGKAGVDIELGNGVEAFSSVPTAIYSFLAYPDSFAQAILHAISLGGDTDTIAAMTGAVSGAYLGFDSIPRSWRNKLENGLYIEELAQKLWMRFVSK